MPKKKKIVFILGFLGVFPNGNVSFFLEVVRNPNTEIFNFGTFMGKKPLITECDFSLLKLLEPTGNTTGLNCLLANMNKESKYIAVSPVDCNSHVANSYFCLMFYKECSDAKNGLVEQLDFIFDPIFHEDQKYHITQQFNNVHRVFKKIDWSNSFKNLFSALWYSSMPCYDLKDLTAHSDKESSFLKYCEWKGIPMPCSQIFTTFPTDIGMCCSFNIKAADDIFYNSTYTKLIKELQIMDQKMSFQHKSISSTVHMDLKTQPGKSRGLTVVLDSHSNLFSPGSNNADTNGFIGLVKPRGSFLLTALDGFELRPGHNNIVAISAQLITSEEGLRGLKPQERNCKFEEENSMLKFYQNYTQTNCLLECSLLFAQKIILTKYPNLHPCTPWFFPSMDIAPYSCDPWTAAEMYEVMLNTPEQECGQCLPDCQTTIYKTTISAVPLRQCLFQNAGLGLFCRGLQASLSNPKIMSSLVEEQYHKRLNTLPFYFKGLFPSSNRTYSSTIPRQDIFGRTGYNPFETDIAKVQIYFKKPTAMEIKRQLTMSWIEFLSNTGGILGLVLGMGVIFFAEVLWILIKLAASVPLYL